MRPNVACQNSEVNSRNFSKSSPRPLQSRESDCIDVPSFDLSRMFSTPIFVDMSGNLYDKINTSVEKFSDSYNNNDHNDESFDKQHDLYRNDFREPVQRTNSESYRQPQTFVPVQPVETESVHQQPVRRSSINSVSDQIRQRLQECPVGQELPVLARFPEVTITNRTVKPICEKSSSFEELMAQTVSGIEQMCSSAQQNKYQQTKMESVEEPKNPEQIIEQSVEKTSVSTSTISESVSTQAKREKFFSTLNWGSFRRLLFSREAIKLSFLTIVVCGLVIAGSIYKSRNSSQEGLQETDMAASQPAALSEPQTLNNTDITPFTSDTVSTPESEQMYSSTLVPQNQTQVQENVYPPALVPGQMGYDMNNSDPYSNMPTGQYAQQVPNAGFENGNILPPNNDSTSMPDGTVANFPNKNQAYTNPNAGFDTMPQFNSTPEYAPVTPAVGNQYSPSDYESPVLEDEPVDYAGSGIPNNEMR